MTYALFIVPSVAPRDEDTVWQLQLLAQAYGFSVGAANRTAHTTLSNAVRAQIRDSDAVILIATEPLGGHALAEIRWAQNLPRPVLALVEETLAKRVPGLNAFTFQRGQDISEIAKRLVEYVGKVIAGKRPRQQTRTVQTALAWILGIGLALLALGALSKNGKKK